jgi:flagellar motor switch protein FliN/FliY
MSDDKSKDGMSEDEKLAAEWESAMEESGDTEDGVEDEWAAAMAEADAVVAKAPDDIKAAPLESFKASPEVKSGNMAPDLDVILDIPVTISMEVGNTSIPIRNLLQSGVCD